MIIYGRPVTGRCIIERQKKSKWEQSRGEIMGRNWVWKGYYKIRKTSSAKDMGIIQAHCEKNKK